MLAGVFVQNMRQISDALSGMKEECGYVEVMFFGIALFI